jgi:hypothetical protein
VVVTVRATMPLLTEADLGPSAMVGCKHCSGGTGQFNLVLVRLLARSENRARNGRDVIWAH